MTQPWTQEEINEYDRLFKTCQNIVGQKVEKISFYSDEDDKDYSEQPNRFGKSLLNAIELTISGDIYCLGNLFFDKSYNGLNIKPGRTTDFENIDNKNLVAYPSEIIGDNISKTIIYWTKSHWGHYFVPQEIEFRAANQFILFSAIEVNNGEVNTPMTDELLVVENELPLKKWLLGKYGVGTNDRYVFEDLEELMINEKNIS